MNNFTDLEKFESLMSDFDTVSLNHICQTAANIIKKRAEQRQRELWGNVLAAINKYQEECGDIKTWCRICGENGTLDPFDKNKPGWFITS